MIDKSKVYTPYTYKDKEGIDFNTEEAIQQLISESVLFANFRRYSEYNIPLGETIILFANCSDVFAWGCSDAEDVSSEEELKSLYEYCSNYGAWEGSTIWACLKRKQKPQAPVAKLLKEKNAWINELDSLEDNKYDLMMKEKYETLQNKD